MSTRLIMILINSVIYITVLFLIDKYVGDLVMLKIIAVGGIFVSTVVTSLFVTISNNEGK